MADVLSVADRIEERELVSKEQFAAALAAFFQLAPEERSEFIGKWEKRAQKSKAARVDNVRPLRPAAK